MATFLEKNKKKSLLALLLLFIRERRVVIAVLLVVALASFLFISPSALILRLPGGARLAASVAWMAGELGIDTEQWGLPEGKRNFRDLLAAFRAAKAGDGKAGWSAFMRGANGAGAGADSLGFVSGRLKDLEGAGGAGAKVGKAQTVAGILNPGDAAKIGEGDIVALSDGDLAGERAGWLRRVFTGGFIGSGSAGGGDSPGGGLSGGAYAGSGFFGTGSGGGGGRGEAGGRIGDRVGAGLAGLSSVTPPKGVAIQGAAKGKLSEIKAAAIAARTTKGVSATRALTRDRAYVQLATGNGLAKVAVSPDCTAPGCPGEFGATNTGAIYDGNPITGAGTDILTAPSVDGTDAPNVPNSGLADGYIKDAEKMSDCAEKISQCESAKQPDYKRLGDLQALLTNLYMQMPGACGDPCDCDPCNNLKSQITSTCGGELQAVIARIEKSCVPASCAGMSAPAASQAAPAIEMCKIQGGSCGSGSFITAVVCILPS